MTNLYLIGELSQKIGVAEQVILEWEKEKLIKAAGFTEDRGPYFPTSIVKECESIQHLSTLGYSLQDIYKIIKKVGLPSSLQNDKETKLKSKFLTIGELADRVDVSTRTIKHWEDKGIIESEMRSDGGFRLFSENYAFLCSLILDLQNFGYTLDEIKVISDYFRDFLAFQSTPEKYEPEFIAERIQQMFTEIERLFATMNKLEEGMERWKGLLKKKRKEIDIIKAKNSERTN